MGDKTRGLYDKFEVKRIDGQSEPGQKHEGCQYFVLDLTHDEFAPYAVMAYAKVCKDKYPELAKDLLNWVMTHS
jgi:hypothetical protein